MVTADAPTGEGAEMGQQGCAAVHTASGQPAGGVARFLGQTPGQPGASGGR